MGSTIYMMKIEPKNKYKTLYNKYSGWRNWLSNIFNSKDNPEDIEEMKNAALELTKFNLYVNLGESAGRFSSFLEEKNYRVRKRCKRLNSLRKDIGNVLPIFYEGASFITKDPEKIKETYKYLLDSVERYVDNLENIKRDLVHVYELSMMYAWDNIDRTCIDEFDELISKFNWLFVKTDIFTEKEKIIRTFPIEFSYT